MPFLTIANQLGLAEGTVRRRVARLLDRKILRIVGITDPFKIGVTYKTSYSRPEGGARAPRSTAEALAKTSRSPLRGFVHWELDLVIQVAVKNNDELLTFLIKKLSEIPGILNTGTSLVLKVAKEDFAWGIIESQIPLIAILQSFRHMTGRTCLWWSIAAMVRATRIVL